MSSSAQSSFLGHLKQKSEGALSCLTFDSKIKNGGLRTTSLDFCSKIKPESVYVWFSPIFLLSFTFVFFRHFFPKRRAHDIGPNSLVTYTTHTHTVSRRLYHFSPWGHFARTRTLSLCIFSIQIPRGQYRSPLNITNCQNQSPLSLSSVYLFMDGGGLAPGEIGRIW